jgi:hypothetical protein
VKRRSQLATHVPLPTPKGCDERDVPYKMEWVRHHDRYEPVPAAGSCCAGQT